MPTSVLVKEMSFGLVWAVLECKTGLCGEPIATGRSVAITASAATAGLRSGKKKIKICILIGK